MIDLLIIDPKIKVQHPLDLLRLPKVLTINTFDEDAAKRFRHDMSMAHRTGQPIIPVVVDSYGGDIYAFLSMYDTIKAARVPVATIMIGKAMSCGAAIGTCGTQGYRFVAPNATLMIHDAATGSASENRKVEEARADAKEVDRLNRKVFQIMDENCGHPTGFFWDLVQQRSRADWYLTPKDAKKLGIANHIKIPILQTHVRVETTLQF